MQGTEYLAIVNKCLRRLREPVVTTVLANQYSSMIGELVNLVKTEIESACQWMDLRNSWYIETEVGMGAYKLLGCNSKAQVLDMWNLTKSSRLAKVSWQWMNMNYFSDPAGIPMRGVPTEFLPNGTDVTTGDWKFDLYPVPDGAYSLQVNMYCPTSDLVADTDLYYGPLQPLIEGVIAYAYKERGEDGGIASKDQWEVYQKLLADAVAREFSQVESDVVWNTGYPDGTRM